MKEIWKEIPGYDGDYQVSNLGKVKSLKNGQEKIMNLIKDKGGYLRIGLSKNNNTQICLVHRLVASMFIPNPLMLREVNHIDGDKTNNNVENLEWTTRSENILHAFRLGLKANKTGSNSPHAKTFYQFNKKGILIRKWGSLVECSKYLAYITKENPETIRINLTATLHNRHKSCCGYYFSFEPQIDLDSKLSKACISVVAYEKGKEDEIVVRFKSLKQAIGYVLPNGKVADGSNIIKCCKGKRSSHAGYCWRYDS